jgi:uncharacterized protein (TIRG00374 family)
MDQADRKQRLKKWLTFAVRWGIAIGGITLVLWNISFHDRVQVLDPSDNSLHKVRVLGRATDADLEFTIVPPGGGEPRRVSRDELWVRPGRTSVLVRMPGGEVRKLKLMAVKPGEHTGAGRPVRELLVHDSDADRNLRVTPEQVVRAQDLRVNSPYVEVGINRLVREADKGYLLAAIFILPLSYVLTSIRWHLLLESLGIRMGPFRTLVINLVGAFYNAFMPGTTGGDLIKAYYAAKHTPLRTRAVLSVLIDRIIGLLALIMLGGAMAAYQWHIPDCRRVAILSGLLLGCVAVGLLVFYNRTLRRFTGLDFILRKLPMQRQVNKAIDAMEIYRHRPWPVLVALLLSFPVHATSILSATFAGWAFPLPLPVFYYWVVVPVIALVGAIPISPQGAGVMEFFAVELTRRHGVTIGQAFILTMSIRMIQVFWNLVAGVFVLRGGYQRPTEKEQAMLEEDTAGAPAPAGFSVQAGTDDVRPKVGLPPQAIHPQPRTL